MVYGNIIGYQTYNIKNIGCIKSGLLDKYYKAYIILGSTKSDRKGGKKSNLCVQVRSVLFQRKCATLKILKTD